MVRGLEIFKKYFERYSEQYVLIGGVACDISFHEIDSDFRATKDFDMVLVIDKINKEFGDTFWRFIHDGGYRNKIKGEGKFQFYRFDKPSNLSFPKMIELFSRTEIDLFGNQILTPIHLDDSVSSLSAILLNEVYYQSLLDGKTIIDGITCLKPTWLIPFKARAWLDLTNQQREGNHVDSRNIKKHKNDIIRLSTEFVLESYPWHDEIKQDIRQFINEANLQDQDILNLDILDVSAQDIIELLNKIYL